jgi:hypothetical protein
LPVLNISTLSSLPSFELRRAVGDTKVAHLTSSAAIEVVELKDLLAYERRGSGERATLKAFEANGTKKRANKDTLMGL